MLDMFISEIVMAILASLFMTGCETVDNAAEDIGNALEDTLTKIGLVRN